jgi:hypothetical protein
LCYGGTSATTAALVASGSVLANTESWNGTSWTEVADVNTARSNPASFGTQTASIVAGGQTPTTINNVESWNGTNWVNVEFLPTPTERAAGAGSQTAGLVSFGTGTAASFEWYGDGKVTDIIQSS